MSERFDQEKEARRLAIELRSDGFQESSFEGSMALARDVLRLAYEAGFREGELNAKAPF